MWIVMEIMYMDLRAIVTRLLHLHILPLWGAEIYAVPASVTDEQDRLKHGMNTTLQNLFGQNGSESISQ